MSETNTNETTAEAVTTEPAATETATARQSDRMPAIYLSHGAPPLADDPIWPGQLADWSKDLPRPKSVLMVSAHWEDAPLALGATTTIPLVYDFWGFPQHYYEVTYAAPGAPQLADSVRKLLRGAGTPVQDVPDRGLDHGAYVPLVEMYPNADIPVLQISMPTLDPRRLLEIGRKLAPLRDEGVLIVGSGFFRAARSARRRDHAAGSRRYCGGTAAVSHTPLPVTRKVCPSAAIAAASTLRTIGLPCRTPTACAVARSAERWTSCRDIGSRPRSRISGRNRSAVPW